MPKNKPDSDLALKSKNIIPLLNMDMFKLLGGKAVTKSQQRKLRKAGYYRRSGGEEAKK